MEKRRILLAEDDAASLKMIQIRLEYEGYEVLTAVDGEEVLKWIEGNGGVDLILMDIKMPKLDGFQVCRRLKANPRTAAIPIIVYTASVTQWEKLVDRCIDLGVADWLKKPFRSEDLLRSIRKVLGEASQEQQET